MTETVRLPLLRGIEAFNTNLGGTNTFTALTRHYAGHDRIVIITDEQAHDAGSHTLPDVPIYTWNLGGYRPAHTAQGERNRYAFGGLNDAAFRMVPIIESTKDGRWPWE
jgi:hypothetical protein